MYAVIEDSGTQIKVTEGDVIKVDLRDLPEDTVTLTFDKVLLVGAGDGDAKIGEPYVAGATVEADLIGEDRTDKIPVVKFKRRKTYKRMKSHRQPYLSVKITSIKA